MDRRAAVLPDVPTIAESGLPGYSMSTWYGAVLPVKTPREIVVKLNQEMLKALALPDVKERLAGVGADIVGNTPEEASALFKADLEKFTRVAKESNISAD
jgi:tripartite-type tricarboxylate transporter receptor subunit TctC